jgi:hypothetical protein
MRASLVLLCAAFLAAILWKTARESVPIKFRNRARVGLAALHRSKFASLRYYDQPVRFNSDHLIFSNQALIVRDCTLMDSTDFEPGNPLAKWGIVALLGAIPNSPATNQQTVESWFQDLVRSDGPPVLNTFWNVWSGRSQPLKLDQIPLLPLAVTNRMDLAHMDGCDSGTVCGAELHFVYAGTRPDNNPYLTLILEFTLQPMPLSGPGGFLDLGQKWEKLGSATPADFATGFPTLLDLVLARVSHARIRVNANNGTTWVFGQFDILGQSDVSGSHRFQEVALDQQANIYIKQCQDASTDLGEFTQKNSSAILNSSFCFHPADHLQTDDPKMNDSDMSVLTLGQNVAGQNLDDLRFALSINSCVGCHGREPQTQAEHDDAAHKYPNGQFDQIHYREPHVNSKLSYFLTGGTTGEPTLDFPPVVPTLFPNCAGGNAQPREFNELVRRHLFLDALVNTPPTSPADWDARFVAMGLVGNPVH